MHLVSSVIAPPKPKGDTNHVSKTVHLSLPIAPPFRCVHFPRSLPFPFPSNEKKRWQETDYRDFRINFIQFMRTPPAAAAADGPELVPVEIVAESESTPGEEEHQETAVQESVQQPVVVDPAVYEGARATEKVCAWPVEEEEEEDDEPEDAVVRAASTAVVVVAVSEPKKSMSSFSLSDSDDTSPPTPPSEEPGTDGGESDESIETAAGISCAAASAALSPEPPPSLPSPFPSSCQTMSAPSPRNEPSAVAVGFSARDGEGADCPAAAAAAAAAGESIATNGGDWDEQETNRRGRVDSSTCSLGWSSMDDEGNDADEEQEKEPDYDGNTIRMGRSFSNLETARRGGAGLSSIVAGGDSSDGDESSDDSEMGGRARRPRALSLDGWFTCGLENGVDTKTYETHDHAGRLRDLVLLVSCRVELYSPSSLAHDVGISCLCTFLSYVRSLQQVMLGLSPLRDFLLPSD